MVEKKIEPKPEIGSGAKHESLAGWANADDARTAARAEVTR